MILDLPLKNQFSFQRICIWIISLLMVGFGQPEVSKIASFLSAILGFALFWSLTFFETSFKKRFWQGTFWFTSVFLIQLYWFLFHPFLYIYPVYFFLSLLAGVQFGLLTALVTKENLGSGTKILGLAGLWVILEWLRLQAISGLSFNLIGLSLASFTASLQIASVIGVLGLSFWVIVTNLLALLFFLKKEKKVFLLWIFCVLSPFVLGGLFFYVREQEKKEFEKIGEKAFLNTLLVQTRFPVEEHLIFPSKEAFITYVIEEWEVIIDLLGKDFQKKRELDKNRLDLIALPELVVPLGTYSFVYPKEVIESFFIKSFLISKEKLLPFFPKGDWYEKKQGNVILVNNAFISLALANLFNTPLLIGLEDAEMEGGTRSCYSTAQLFTPFSKDLPLRYEKRILVPMGEYIPGLSFFPFLQNLAASYGMTGGFCHGKEAKAWPLKKGNIAPCICYEETFGNVMKENKKVGANVLVNLTSDVWYPGSSLTLSHLEHARPRTVENGIPLVRASNTGITGVIDSLGQTTAQLGTNWNHEGIRGTLFAKVSLYNYFTLYSIWGDALILIISFISLFLYMWFMRKGLIKIFFN